MHHFHDSLAKGTLGETVITNFMQSKGYTVERLDVTSQKAYGYDLYCEDSNFAYQLEVKTEYGAEKSGNVFYETAVGDKPGWCLKYQGLTDVQIVWYLPVSHRALTLPANRLHTIPYHRYPKRTVRNPGYQAQGHLVPLVVIEEIAIEWKLPPNETDLE